MKQLLSIRKSLIITLLMLMGMNLDAKNVNINDIAGSWKMIPDKGMVMAGDIIMNISTTSISQALYSEKKGTKTDLLNGIFYLSDVPATSWNADKLGKILSGAYMVINVNGRMSQKAISFDNNGLLVLVPYGTENGMTMRFRRISKDEIPQIDQSYTDEDFNLMNGFITLYNREQVNPLLVIYTPGSLIWQLKEFISEYDTKNMTTLRVGGPINGMDLIGLTLPDELRQEFPKLNTLDLSMAWFVSDTIPYNDHMVEDYNHELFTETIGIHMQRNPQTDSIGGLVKVPGDTCVNVLYDRFGWGIEEKKDSSYIHLCTTIDDCISHLAFNDVPWLEDIILPITTREIHEWALADCPKLKEITIPSSVMEIYDFAFANDSALTVVRVAEDSNIISRLRDDLNSEEPKIFYGHNPNLRIETYSTKRPDVTFTIRGRSYSSRLSNRVLDYSSKETLYTIEPNTREFSFKVTVPQYSIIHFYNQKKDIIAEGGDVYIDLENDSLSGTPLNDKLHRYNMLLEEMEKEVSGALVMTDKFACVDSAAIFKARVDTARMNFHRLIYKIFLSNYNNCISTYMLSKYYKSMPIEIGKMLFMATSPDIASTPLLYEEWERVKESSRTVHFDCFAFSDTRFMKTVKNLKAGELNKMLSEEEWDEIKRLKVEGPINTRDIRWLRSLCSGKMEGELPTRMLIALDLTNAYIVDSQGKTSTYMPDSAFANISYLKYIALPKNITVIGKMCFCGNYLDEIKIYDNVHTIKSKAFAGSHCLHDIKLPANLERIEDLAFAYCFRLRDMILPNKVKEIGRGAFENCENLRRLHIPASTKKIGESITSQSLNVAISIDAANKDYKEISNVIVALNDAARESIGQTYAKYLTKSVPSAYKVRYKMVNGKKVRVSIVK